MPSLTPRFAVVIPAAGLGVRFGRNKLHEPLAGRSVLLRTLEAFLGRPDVAAIVVATPAGLPPADALPSDARARVRGDATVRLVEGGGTRAASVRRALAAVPAGVAWVAVHDAARPLVPPALIDRLFAHAVTHGSAVPAMPVRLTVKQADGPLPAVVARTLDRHTLWEMQTPQVFRRDELITAFAAPAASVDAATDDAQVMEQAGFAQWLVAGDERNLKITTPPDLWLAERLLATED